MAEQAEKTAAAGNKGTVTPELVRQVAEKVYELWQRELAIERERQRPFSRR
jgi:hypothetical protein